MTKVANLDYTLKTLFHKYRDESLLARLENYALWTIPSVFPKEQLYYNYQNKQIEYDCQSINAGLVYGLATKLTATLFPANTSFFRIELSEQVRAILEENQIADVISYENKACERLFLNASYAQLIQMMLQLIVCGECLIHRVNDSIKTYSLRDYSVKRNNVGETLDIIIREHKYYEELPPDVQQAIGNKPADYKLCLYTRVKRKVVNGFVSWDVTQEIEGRDIGTRVTYRDKLCPYIPVMWSFVNGDNYARGHVETYAADIYKVSRMSEALADYEFESLRILHLVNPNTSFDTRSAEEAATGAYIQGDPNGAVPYEAGDYQKIQVINADIASIVSRLSKAFMDGQNQREGERVTAYEVRLGAEEAEQVLGGVYSQLSQSLHLPLAYLLLDEANSAIIDDIDKQNIKLSILTGLQALARSSVNQNLVIAASEMNSVIPVFVQTGGNKWNVDKIMEGILAANGVDPSTLQYTEAEMKQIQEQQQAQQAQQMAAQMSMGANAQQMSNQNNAVDAVNTARGGL